MGLVVARAQRLTASRRQEGRARLRGRSTPASAQRLTASRRQEVDCAPSGHTAANRAQRLTASRRQEAAKWPFARQGWTRAQRLTASRRQEDQCRYLVHLFFVVLNALRHHGDKKPPLRCGCRFWSAVLNALRHHGDKKPKCLDTFQNSSMCSTPYGITATRRRSAPHGISVWYSCSTPYGITATRRRTRSRLEPHLGVLNALRHHGDKKRLA